MCAGLKYYHTASTLPAPGTGQIVVQLAKRAGFKVIGTCSTGKVALCEGLGCDAVVDYSTGNDVAARVKEITGGAGCAAVFDGVGKATHKASIASVGRRGRHTCASLVLQFSYCIPVHPCFHLLTLFCFFFS